MVLSAFTAPLAIAALLCEALAVWFLANVPQGTSEVALFFAIHFAASVFTAMLVAAHVPERYRRPRGAVLLLLGAFAFFIPFLGILALVVGLLTVLTVPGPGGGLPFNAVRSPEFTTPIREGGARMRSTGLRTMLFDPTLAPELRLRSLMALQNMSVRRAGPLLRTLLGDPTDDMRLTAYALLERESKRLGEAISGEIVNLPKKTTPAARFGALRRIAEQQWELVYTGVAQADLAAFALDEGLRYADAALAIVPQDGGLWMLKGRMFSAKGDDAAAIAAYEKAISLGLPAERAAPYLAEIAFREGRFADVRAAMARVEAGVAPAMVAPVARFWAAPATPPRRPA
jgi:tetratricopeptide (TPR) repeat protein